MYESGLDCRGSSLKNLLGTKDTFFLIASFIQNLSPEFKVTRLEFENMNSVAKTCFSRVGLRVCMFYDTFLFHISEFFSSY